ncbi:hypothetical protein DFR86_11475 [Acidianus sulfidivorans JP7]|nr:hypothetical protein [Acidianus sulfidivorans]AWR98092.2 hypothetical protein DFR86_11475 [Acidianus sulfidivorans JP7]
MPNSKTTYRVDFDRMKVKIALERKGERHLVWVDADIVGYPRTLEKYMDLTMGEAGLVKRNEELYLNVTLKKKLGEVKPNGLIVVDVNMDSVYLGNDKEVTIIPTRLSEAHHYKSLAENLQRKYSKR